jgi:hypothetical protein
MYNSFMKPVSVYLPESAYQEMKSIAERQGRPVAELIRQGMMDYLERERKANRSIMEIPPHKSGKLLKGWTRSDILEEMLES